MEVRQRAQIKVIQTRFDLAELEMQRQRNIAQREADAMRVAKLEREELEAARKQLARLLPENERLQAIENVTNRLPQLLRTLAANISDDMVLDVVRNSKSGSNIDDVMVIGWTDNYSSGQAFAMRVHEALAVAGLGYSVAQTDVRAGSGRTGKPGYFVSFWLVPRAQTEELGAEHSANAANAGAAEGGE